MTRSILISACMLGLFQTTADVEALPFHPEDWKDLPRVEVRVKEGGQMAVYSGVPLRAVLAGKLDKKDNSMASLRSLADAVLLVRAGDDYQAAVSAAAVAMDEKGEKFLLALERDGKPLDAKHGPVQLIVPGDPQRVRWVRMVVGVDLVRMPKAKAKAKPSR